VSGGSEQTAGVAHDALKKLLALLDLEEIDPNLYRGLTSQEPRPRVFGGHVAGQALVAAGRTAPGMAVHSLHAYFLRPGEPALPIVYTVTRIRDGKSFVTRLVVASQRGEAIFNLSAQFHVAEPGFEHQAEMPNVPPPEQCTSWDEWMKPISDRLPSELLQRLLRERPIEIRPVDPIDMLAPVPGGFRQSFWMRASDAMPDDPLLHQCVATYASDHTLLGAAMRPHGKTFLSRDLMAASLEHAMWFHRPFRMDEWILYSQQSPASFGGRGLAFGCFFTQAGTLVASVAQEGLIRPVDEQRKR
jgi:acyl-CoA thioesterase II